MIDKDLLRLLGENKKYIFLAVGLMLLGLAANIGVTACICWAIALMLQKAPAVSYQIPAVLAAGAILVRYLMTRLVGGVKDRLGRNAKRELRSRIYDKILRLGVRTNEQMSMAGLTQVSMEGVEQLDLYYSNYIPQFFYAMMAPLVLFLVTVGIQWRVALVLICCVPLIPMSIVAVSKYAKKIFAKYWDKYTSMGDDFLDSVQGLKELKIFKADAARHEKMNRSAEEFRRITMKVLVMQLASTTIMDLVAYGGAALGIAMSILSVLYWGLEPIRALFLVLVAVEFFLPLRAFGSAFHIAMNGASAGKKILTLLESPDPEWGSEDAGGTDLALKHVTFSYDGERNVLKDVCMDFPSHGMTAIVGESGCGKSTVVNLLLGVYRPQKGSVTVGGKEISTLSRDNYYKHVGVVSCSTYLFHATVRENFAMEKPDVTDAEMYEALEHGTHAELMARQGGYAKIYTAQKNLEQGYLDRDELEVQAL